MEAVNRQREFGRDRCGGGQPRNLNTPLHRAKRESFRLRSPFVGIVCRVDGGFNTRPLVTFHPAKWMTEKIALRSSAASCSVNGGSRRTVLEFFIAC